MEITGPELLIIAERLEPILLIASEINNNGKKVQKKVKHSIIIRDSFEIRWILISWLWIAKKWIFTNKKEKLKE